MKDGNGTVHWADAQLTGGGERQARAAGIIWQNQIDRHKMMTPESYYVSPLTRCLQTANLTFKDLKHTGQPFVPTVKEVRTA